MPNRQTITILSVCFSLSVTYCAMGDTPNQAHWPQWRGPQRDGQVSVANWPSSLKEQHLVEQWALPLGPGYSGPIVSNDRVFVTETKDEKFEVVHAFDRNTSEQLWETQWEGSMKVPFFAASNGSWIRATPALDDDRLYVAGMKDVLVCLDVKSGNILWKLDFANDTGSPLPDFGFISSPLVHGDHIYVQAGASFAKLDKLTGKIVWQTLRDQGGMNGSAFSSPVFATLAGVEQFVVQTRSSLAGVSPEDGAVLWTKEVSAFRGMNILTPTVIGNSIFTSCYGGRSSLYKIERRDSQWDITEEWTHKSQGYMSSPLVIDGHIYLHLKNQRFVCLDAKSGADLWTTTPFGKYWSMVANGTMLLALDEVGELLLIQASPEEFKLIDRVTVADNAWAHIAIEGEQIFVRNIDKIKVFSWK